MIEEAVKNRIILIVSTLCLIFFFWAIGAHSEIGKYKKNMQDEIRKRIEMEEQNTNFLKEKSNFVESIKQLTAQLEEEKAVNQATKKALVEEQLMNDSLKQEVEKEARLKQVIEEDLKEALMKDSQKQKKQGSR
ncbi:MAG: hypothetical protein AABY43_01655 [Candidatus Omnitrophota bacterium]|jgi:hypothetical protein